MIDFFRRLTYKIVLWWNDPQADVRADYETLVRLARRCAYDFSHASDFIPNSRKQVVWSPDIEWDKRAAMWIGLFAKGNPGKDYRIKTAMDLAEAESSLEQMVKIMQANGLEDEIPGRVKEKYILERIPF